MNGLSRQLLWQNHFAGEEVISSLLALFSVVLLYVTDALAKGDLKAKFIACQSFAKAEELVQKLNNEEV